LLFDTLGLGPPPVDFAHEVLEIVFPGDDGCPCRVSLPSDGPGQIGEILCLDIRYLPR
jgi:hypothetical protein